MLNHSSLFAHFSFFRHFISLFCIGGGIACIGYSIFVDEASSPLRTLWVIDTSLSMGVEDIFSTGETPRMSRLDLARALMLSGVESIPGDHAIISYARDARLETPFNSDKEHLTNIIASLALVEFYGGSDLMTALKLFSNTYTFSDTPTRFIILTDGGSTQSGSFFPLSSKYSGHIFSLGTLGGGNIPLGYNALGDRRYKYASGGVVIAPYDSEYIDRISEEYGFPVFHFEKRGRFPNILSSISNPKEYPPLLFFGSFAILFGYFLPLHAKKR